MFCKSLLYLHTCITDGSQTLFTPRVITKFLSREKVRLAAITDVNTCLNAPAFSICCKRYGIHALYGMEAWCKDQKAVILFSNLVTAMDFNNAWYLTLPASPSSVFEGKDSRQCCVDEDDSILFIERKYLKVRSSVSFQQVKDQLEGKSAIVFPLDMIPPSVRGNMPLKQIEQLRESFLRLDTESEDFFCEQEEVNLQAIRTGVEKLQAF